MASSEISRVRERSKCRKRLNEIYDEAINAYLIHYSCESFYVSIGTNSATDSHSKAAIDSHLKSATKWQPTPPARSALNRVAAPKNPHFHPFGG
jgi:hypothetical protein